MIRCHRSVQWLSLPAASLQEVRVLVVLAGFFFSAQIHHPGNLALICHNPPTSQLSISAHVLQWQGNGRGCCGQPRPLQRFRGNDCDGNVSNIAHWRGGISPGKVQLVGWGGVGWGGVGWEAAHLFAARMLLWQSQCGLMRGAGAARDVNGTRDRTADSKCTFACGAEMCVRTHSHIGLPVFVTASTPTFQVAAAAVQVYY